MPIGPRGERLPYPGEPGAGMGAGPGPDMPPMNPGMGVGPGPDRPPQMPPIEAVVARKQDLQAELQQLVALAEQMGAGGQGPPMPPQGMLPGPPGLLG